MTSDPITPYAGTSGWAGTDTSRDRAARDDSNGTTSRRQWLALRALEDSMFYGRTWRELADVTGMHHGQASGVLTLLHKAGKIARLADKREQCRIYVHLDYVEGRDTEPYTPRVAPADVEEMAETIREAYATLAALGVFDDE